MASSPPSFGFSLNFLPLWPALPADPRSQASTNRFARPKNPQETRTYRNVFRNYTRDRATIRQKRPRLLQKVSLMGTIRVRFILVALVVSFFAVGMAAFLNYFKYKSTIG